MTSFRTTQEVTSPSRVVLIFLLAMAAAVGIVACDRDTPAPSTVPSAQSLAVIRLGYRSKVLGDPTPPALATLAADPERPFRVELVPLSTPADGFNKLASGEVDAVAAMPLEAVFQQLSAGGEPKFFAYAFSVDRAGDEWVSIVARKGSGIEKLADAAGKTAVVAPTDQAEWLMRQMLLKAGVPENQIKIVRHGPQTPLLGFKSGEHDLILTAEPVISLALADGGSIIERGPISRLLFNGADVPVTASLLSAKFVQEHPDAARAFQAEALKTASAMRATPERFRELFAAEAYGALPPQIRSRFSFAVVVAPTQSIRDGLTEFHARLIADGILKTPVRVERLFTAQLTRDNP